MKFNLSEWALSNRSGIGVSQMSTPSAFTPSKTVTVFPGSESGTPGYHDQ